MKWKIEKRKKKKETKRLGNSYSGDAYPNVPIGFVYSKSLPYIVALASPKSSIVNK